MLKSPLCSLTVVAAFLIVCCHRAQGRTLISHRENMKQVNSWRCSDPRPHLVYLEDEYEEFDSGNVYLPHVAVVNRCDRTTGCCTQPGHECSALVEEEIDFTFQIFRPDGSKQKTVIPLKNHLICECRKAYEEKH